MNKNNREATYDDVVKQVGKHTFESENNSIQKKEPKVEKTYISRQVGSPMGVELNAGYATPIGWLRAKAGKVLDEFLFESVFRTQPILAPTSTKWYINIELVEVPNIRVWSNARAYHAQKDNPYGQPPLNRPQFAVREGAVELIRPLPSVFFSGRNNQGDVNPPNLLGTHAYTNINNPAYEQYSVLNRIYPNLCSQGQSLDALPLRSFTAYYNDIMRNKLYMAPRREFTGDTVTSAELAAYGGFWLSQGDPGTGWLPAGTSCLRIEADLPTRPRRNSFDTSFRRVVNTKDNPQPSGQTTSQLNIFNQMLSELRDQADDGIKNDWDIISKEFGAPPADDDQVKLISSHDFPLNFDQEPQTVQGETSPNSSFGNLGSIGGFSATHIKADLLGNMKNYKINQHATILVIATLQCEGTALNGVHPYGVLNNWTDEYRPNFKDLKDVPFQEQFVHSNPRSGINAIYGWRRQFEEDKTMPNLTTGALNPRSGSLSKNVIPQVGTDQAIYGENRSYWLQGGRQTLPDVVGWITDDSFNEMNRLLTIRSARYLPFSVTPISDVTNANLGGPPINVVINGARTTAQGNLIYQGNIDGQSQSIHEFNISCTEPYTREIDENASKAGHKGV